MGKKAIITIDDSHEVGGESESSTLTTTGSFERTDDGCVLSYDEVGDLFGNVTQITLKGDRVTMERKGKNNAQLIIEKNKRYNCLYTTDYAELMLGISGRKVRSEINEKGGRLYLSYGIDFSSGFSSNNELTVSFRFE